MRTFNTLICLAFAVALILITAGHAQSASKRFQADSAALTGVDVAKAVTAAKRLGVSRTPKATSVLLNGLAMGLHPQVAVAALMALTTQRSAEPLDTVLHYRHHRNPKVRAAALRAMASLGGAAADQAILDGLRDYDRSVRAAAIAGVVKRTLKRAYESLLALIKKGDVAAADAVGVMGDVEIARHVGELTGTAANALVATALGRILRGKNLKEDSARVEVVRVIGKVPGPEAVEQLTLYLSEAPEKQARQSLKIAEAVIAQRLEGGQ